MKLALISFNIKSPLQGPWAKHLHLTNLESTNPKILMFLRKDFWHEVLHKKKRGIHYLITHSVRKGKRSDLCPITE